MTAQMPLPLDGGNGDSMIDAHRQSLEDQINRLMGAHKKARSEKTHLESVVRMLEREVTQRSDEINRLEHELIMLRRGREEAGRFESERLEMRDKIENLLRDLESVEQE
jgi:chromosome segregation ATPase